MVGRPLAVVDDVVVVEAVEGKIAEIPHGRLGVPELVEEGDILADVALRVPVIGADFELLGIEIFLPAGDREEFTELETGIDAVIAGHRRGQGQPRAKPGTAARLQIQRVDVGRVDEEVHTHEVGAFLLRQLGQIFLQLPLLVAPREVGIGLVVADLGEALHHLRPGKRLGEEDHAGIDLVDFGDHPLPERERLGVRVVDAEDADAMLQPEQEHVAHRMPDRWQRIAIEVEVDDILIFLRRILCVFDGAVRPPVEPFGMVLDPRMVGRGVKGDVEGDFQAVPLGGVHHPPEVVHRSQFGMDRLVAPVLRADRVGAADIVLARRQRVVAALAVGLADGVDRREIQDVEAHFLDVRQARDHVVEAAVDIRVA